MAYFSNYIDTLKNLKNTVAEDIKSFEEDDDRLLASLINFKKEVEQLIDIVSNNSAIEGKVSQLPKNAGTHWWAGSGDEPNHQGAHESMAPLPDPQP